MLVTGQCLKGGLLSKVSSENGLVPEGKLISTLEHLAQIFRPCGPRDIEKTGLRQPDSVLKCGCPLRFSPPQVYAFRGTSRIQVSEKGRAGRPMKFGLFSLAF